NGTYNCTFNTSANPGIMPARGYTIVVNTSKTYHNPANISVSYSAGSTSFWVETPPVLSNPSHNTSDLVDPYGWGETWNFSVNLTNEDYDSIDLDLWLRNNVSGSWTAWALYKPLGQTHTIEGITTEFSIQSYVLQSHNDFEYDDIGSWNFKWNATEDDAYIDETNYTNFTVKPDNTEVLYSLGDNATLNRSNTTHTVTLRVRINDTDRDVIVQLGGTAYFYVTRNNDTYAISEDQYTWQLDTSTGISGQFYTDTFPTSARCLYPIGPQKWRVNYTNPSYGYYNASSILYNINISTEPLQVSLELPVTNTTVRKYEDGLFIRGNITDDCAATNGPVPGADTITLTVEEEAYTCSGWNDEGNGWYNCTIPSSAMNTWLYDYYNISMQATKQYYNDSPTTSYKDRFILVSSPHSDTMTISTTPLETIYTSYTTTNWGWGELWTFTAYFQDEDHSTSNFNDQVNISLYMNTTTGWRFINSTIRSDLSNRIPVSLTYHSFNWTDMGDKIFKFNITDTFNYTNNTNDTQSIDADTVYIYYEATYEPASIDREGPSTGEFKFRIRDTDNGTWVPENVNTSFWFSTDNTYITWGPRFNNTTESDGFSYFNFDPNCSYIIGTGVHYWYGGIWTNDYRYQEQYTNTSDGTDHDFQIRGQLKNWIITPNWTAGQPNFNVTDQIPVRFNVTSECANIGAENPIANIDTPRIELQAPSSAWESPYTPDQYQSGFYNITWDSTSKQEGNWTIRLNTSENYYNDNSTALTNWFWLENIPPANGTLPEVAPASDGWSMLYNYTLNLTDQE
ncbi:MAG: hypothetical protein ACYTBJ_25020, partial [Planctomycetota bacterium]